MQPVVVKPQEMAGAERQPLRAAEACGVLALGEAAAQRARRARREAPRTPERRMEAEPAQAAQAQKESAQAAQAPARSRKRVWVQASPLAAGARECHAAGSPAWRAAGTESPGRAPAPPPRAPARAPECREQPSRAPPAGAAPAALRARRRRRRSVRPASPGCTPPCPSAPPLASTPPSQHSQPRQAAGRRRMRSSRAAWPAAGGVSRRQGLSAGAPRPPERTRKTHRVPHTRLSTASGGAVATAKAKVPAALRLLSHPCARLQRV